MITFNGIGAKVEVYANNTQQLKEVYASRGYQSSVSTNLIFGLGESKIVDSLKVIWNDGKTEVITNIEAGILKEEVLSYELIIASEDVFSEKFQEVKEKVEK